MPVTTRIAAPNYKIYEPDALDAIYAKGNLDPIMGGISYAFGNAKKLNSSMDQEDFIRQQAQYNRMAAALDAMEIDSKTKQEALKIGGSLIAKGEDPTKVIGGYLIYNNPADNSLPGLERGVLSSKIAAQSAATSADRGKDMDTVTTKTQDPNTPGIETTVTSKRKPGSTNPVVTVPNTIDPRTSTPVLDNPRNAEAQIRARISAAVGTDKPAVKDAGGGKFIVTNPQNNKSAIFDSKGNQVRQ